MNEAGRSAGPARGSFKLELDHVLVLHDEIDLPFGEIRTRLGGGLAGHNGLKSLKRELGSPDFHRVRIGVGRPDSTDPDIVAAYVLGRWQQPKTEVADLISRAADEAERIVTLTPRDASRSAALTDDIFRVGVFPEGMPVEYRSEAVVFDREPSGDAFADPGRGRADLASRRTAGSSPPMPTACCAFSKARAEGERYFGCGERTAGLEKTGSHQVFWNVDPPEGHTASFNNLYTSIPFVLSLARRPRARALPRQPGPRRVRPRARPTRRASPRPPRGSLVYYVFAGPTPRDVLAQYTELTGRISLPPLWALGNQQSKWGYEDADEVRAIARGYRERGIPCDVRLPRHRPHGRLPGLHVRRRALPGPGGVRGRARGRRVQGRLHHRPGREGRRGLRRLRRPAASATCTARPSAATEYRNVVWPGLCAFPDFTNPEAREWWGDQQAPLVDAGVAGVWCDMDEPALFVPDQSTMPDDVVHPGGGEPRHHADVHNLYGSLMARAAREGLQRLRPDKRPFVITRAGYAGLQRRRAPVDGRQLVLVGAPVDEHAAAAEPRAVRRELLRRRRRRLLRRLRRRAAGALDRVRDLPAVLPQPLLQGHGPAGAVGVRRAVGDASAATC